MRFRYEMLRWISEHRYARLLVSRLMHRSDGPAPYRIRVHGDPVLKTVCRPVETIDDNVRRLAEDMITTMYLAPGVGLAANQVGMQVRLFVYDANDGKGPRVVINPRIVERDGEQEGDEGCLSVPELYFDLARSNHVVMHGTDLEGNDMVIDAHGFEARILQHELDHLDGTLILKHLTPEHRKDAMRALREQSMRG